jgi:hypothetical protein
MNIKEWLNNGKPFGLGLAVGIILAVAVGFGTGWVVTAGAKEEAVKTAKVQQLAVAGADPGERRANAHPPGGPLRPRHGDEPEGGAPPAVVQLGTEAAGGHCQRRPVWRQREPERSHPVAHTGARLAAPMRPNVSAPWV